MLQYAGIPRLNRRPVCGRNTARDVHYELRQVASTVTRRRRHNVFCPHGAGALARMEAGVRTAAEGASVNEGETVARRRAVSGLVARAGTATLLPHTKRPNASRTCVSTPRCFTPCMTSIWLRPARDRGSPEREADDSGRPGGADGCLTNGQKTLAGPAATTICRFRQSLAERSKEANCGQARVSVQLSSPARGRGLKRQWYTVQRRCPESPHTRGAD